MNQRYTVPMTYILHPLPAYRVHAYVSVVARGLNTSTTNAVATATLSKRERGYHSQRGQRRLGDLQGVRDGGRAGRADLVGCLRARAPPTAPWSPSGRQQWRWHQCPRWTADTATPRLEHSALGGGLEFAHHLVHDGCEVRL